MRTLERPLSTKNRWVAWQHVVFRRLEVGQVAMRRGRTWVELYARLYPAKWFGLMRVYPRRRWDQLSGLDREELFMSFLDQLKEAQGKKLAGTSCADEKFQKQYPALFEYMTATAFSDGQERTPCSITVFAEDGQFKVCLAERDLDMTLWGTGETFQEALRCVEDRLKGPNPDWRRKKAYKGKGKG